MSTTEEITPKMKKHIDDWKTLINDSWKGKVDHVLAAMTGSLINATSSNNKKLANKLTYDIGLIKNHVKGGTNHDAPYIQEVQS